MSYSRWLTGRDDESYDHAKGKERISAAKAPRRGSVKLAPLSVRCISRAMKMISREFEHDVQTSRRSIPAGSTY